MRRQADPARAAARFLERQLAPLGAGSLLPRDWTPRSPAFLLVADDGGPLDWPVASRHALRVTAFAADRHTARDAAARAQAELLAGGLSAVSFPSRRAHAITDALDPETGGWTASFIAVCVARTVNHP